MFLTTEAKCHNFLFSDEEMAKEQETKKPEGRFSVLEKLQDDLIVSEKVEKEITVLENQKDFPALEKMCDSSSTHINTVRYSPDACHQTRL